MDELAGLQLNPNQHQQPNPLQFQQKAVAGQVLSSSSDHLLQDFIQRADTFNTQPKLLEEMQLSQSGTIKFEYQLSDNMDNKLKNIDYDKVHQTDYFFRVKLFTTAQAHEKVEGYLVELGDVAAFIPNCDHSKSVQIEAILAI